jgi:type II secretory pathway pseudopilin PulG
MIAVVVILAIMLIFSTVATKSWHDVMRREREAEMIFRAQEITRAIAKYRKAQGRLPNALEELMEPGPQGQYFLRRQYEDPLVPDGKWGLLFAAPGGGLLDPNAPGGGLLDPNAPGGETRIPEIGGSSRRPTNPQDALTPGFGGGQPSGLPIVGVKSLCTDRPFRVYKGQRDYATWQFSIFDLEPQLAQGQGTIPENNSPQQNPRVPRNPGGGGRR